MRTSKKAALQHIEQILHSFTWNAANVPAMTKQKRSDKDCRKHADRSCPTGEEEILDIVKRFVGSLFNLVLSPFQALPQDARLSNRWKKVAHFFQRK